jgi:beta-lactamase regulating signal transducer with metallopeptidase domain
MADWSSSHFLQALGWATLNSFWQMALLWCIFQLLTHFAKLTSNQKYLLAVSNVFVGFVWFLLSFSIYYKSGFNETALSRISVELSPNELSIVLSCASLTYLLLLVVPTVRIARNWLFLKQIKKVGVGKAPYRYRLFAQRISGHLGIKKPVKVYLSALVSSPMTVGFLKPIILIPIASINNLSVQQLEAVLLHELSHIKRQDYIINLLMNLIQTILYFNPFIKLFIKRAEVERENCCDELVLQFEYDKHSYAAALLQLEKNAQGIPDLAMAAANKNYLLSRIEKIVGIKKKPAFNTYHFSGAFAVVLMLFVINSVLIAGKEKLTGLPFHDMSEPFAFFVNKEESDNQALAKQVVEEKTVALTTVTTAELPTEEAAPIEPEEPSIPEDERAITVEAHPSFVQVALDETEASLAAEQKEQVAKTIHDTRRVLEMNWSEIEKSIGNDMTAQEKAMAKQQYLTEIEKINWKNVEKGLKTQYNVINWEEINENLSQTIALARIDSLHEVCDRNIAQLHKLKALEKRREALILPDESIKQVQKVKADAQKRLDELQKIRAKKVVVRL